MEEAPAIERRAVLWAGAVAVLTACGGRATSAPATAAPARTVAPAVSPAVLPRFVPWTAHPGENEVTAKTAAVREIERRGNAGAHRLHVVDAQYCGLLTDIASVLVVCDSWSVDGSTLVADGHTFDVRVSRIGRTWRVTGIHPSSPGPAVVSPSVASRHVLNNSHIDLPPAARADVESGQVHDQVLEAMLTLSRRWAIAVSVIRSGHPLYVFGTARLSDHPRGRAFDTWAIDHTPVVAAGAPHPAVSAYMEALASLGSYNVGGPIRLGAAPQYFTDATHHDHVHAGFLT